PGDPRDPHSFPTRRSSDLLMSDIRRPELKAKAQAAFAEARAQMEEVARTFPDCATGTQQQVIECALAKSYAERPARDEVEAKARSEEHTSELQSRENLVCR